MTTTTTSSTYLVIEAERNYGGDIIRSKVVRSRQSQPDRLDADQVVIRVRIALPGSAFEPLAAALITIPEDRIVRGPIEVVVESQDVTA